MSEFNASSLSGGVTTLTAPHNAAGGRAAVALENNANNFSPPRPAVDPKWLKLDWLRRESTVKRQRLCLVVAHSDRVGVRQSADSLSLAGVITCGSRLCPVCGPRIAARNREDIVQAVRAWREGEGGRVLFGTFTVRHRRGMPFQLSREAVSAGWHRVTAGKGWVNDRRRHGIEHWVRVFEEKYSDESGWHLHLHYLVFVRPESTASPEAVLGSMFQRWRAGVLTVPGMGTPVLEGQDLHEVTGDNADEILGEYFTKQLAQNELKTADSIGFELTNRDGKFRSGILTQKSFTPGELLTLAVTGDEHARLLWAEYEQGMRKRRVIAWSRGLRSLVGVGDEASDQELAAMDDGELRATVLEMMRREWKKLVSKPGRRSDLMRRVWRDGAESTVAWLELEGIRAVVGEIDDYGETVRGGSDA